ncbi:MAG TPA: chalcone isomerase family protein [Thermoanaerobaculia bacterium]|nr:chalcone isomerase family protein [Thermoanaerobaculia bacterium]
MARFALAFSFVLAALDAGAVTIAGAKIEDTVSVNSQNLVLNGAGIRKKFMIKVYVGALYLSAKQSNAAAILAADAPRRMVMHFVFSVGKDKIAEAWQEGLADNTPNASLEVKTAFKTLASWMEDVKDGQRVVLTYVPGIGTTVEVNGKNKGTLGGKAVADAIVNTWIGPKPGPGDDFKKAVLGQK